jgi:type 1 glutamine amidotransferase
MANAPSNRKRFILLALAFLAVLVAIGVLRLLPSIRAAGGNVPPVIDRVPPELPPEIGGDGLDVLLFSKTSGFRHEDAIPAAAASLERIAQSRGWRVFATENAAVFNDEQLARFDVLVANNTTGDNWTTAQKDAFVRWVEKAGGGAVGVHGALGTRYRYWNWYTDVLFLGRFTGHPMLPQFQEANVVIEDPDHPAMRHFGPVFVHEDEWYSFEKSARELGAHVLATLDEESYDPSAFGDDLGMGDHPIVWVACPGEGRVFYSALGHSAETYERPEHEKMLEGAVAWAGGLDGSCP